MLGKIASAGILGLLALCAGCTLPCHPYDHCGPVYDGSGQYCSNIRAGSILDSGDTQSISENVDQGVIEETSSNVQQSGIYQGSPMVREVEGATQIISVTDRKVEDTETEATNQPETTQSKPALAQPTSSKLRWR